MRMIVGLGNPGRQYEGSAHNLGFDAVEILARRWGLTWRLQERFRSEIAEGPVAGQPVTLVKPLTFMNRSGEALGLLTRQRDLGDNDLLVIADDVSLPIGRLRVRADGGHGGHNGLRSLIERLGHQRFARLRIGILSDQVIEDLADYVLRKQPPQVRNQLGEMAEIGADAAEMWLRESLVAVADRYNGLRRFESTP